AIGGPWEVRFAPGWGAPERIELPELISWSDHSESGVRYFSGKATYAKTVQLPASLIGRGRILYLDLGAVEVMARVKWNGIELGILWKKPFRIDITGAARAGANRLELTVVNLWPNRLIGDANLPEDCEWGPAAGAGTLQQNIVKYPDWLLEGKPSPTGRFTFSIIRVWPGDARLRKSGLLGPVTVVSAMKVRAGLRRSRGKS
ncbi:MAG: glycosyl hydrolase family 43, partial [Acidobacteria bacterium]|nr:glycosyl hydrolase family 43 [Acidobacteriota bacterium]